MSADAPAVAPARRGGRRAGALVLAVLVVVGAGGATSAEERRPPPSPPSPTGVDAGRSAVGHVVPPDLEDVEHMCALLTGCDKLPLPSGLVPRDFASCVRAVYDELASPAAVSFSLTLRDCGLRASSCGELRTCALRGARPDACAGRGKSGAVDLCDGDGRAITCNGERVVAVRDCPRGGEQCVVREGKAMCALGPCAADSPPACSASGTRILECKHGRLASLECAAFGLQCAMTSEGPRCTTQGKACTGDAVRCEGNVAVGCLHGHEVRVDCAAAGLGCGATGVGAVGVCSVVAPPSTPSGPAPTACDPATPPRCEGATLRYCARGKPRAYLCKAVGLARCVADERGPHCSG